MKEVFLQIYVIALDYYYLSRSTFEREFTFPQSIIVYYKL